MCSSCCSRGPERIDDLDARDARGGRTERLRRRSTSLPTTDMGDVEPFGFADGISQPSFDWDRARTPGTKADRAYTNLIALGEILLGYHNEYGFPADSPKLAPGDPNAALLQPGRRRSGRSRPRAQRLLSRLSPARPGRARLLALGRRGGRARRRRPAGARRGHGRAPHGRRAACPISRPGSPFRASIRPTAALNGFLFDADPGRPLLSDRRPYPARQSAHRRRACRRRGRDRQSSRDARAHRPPAAEADLLHAAVGGEHDRLALPASRGRRDRLGPLPPHPAPRPRIRPEDRPCGGARSVDARPRGRASVHLPQRQHRPPVRVRAGRLARQRQIRGPDRRAGPALGNREPFPAPPVSETPQRTDSFTRPGAEPACRRAIGLPQFVTVKGGAYFFMPGLAALKWIASLLIADYSAGSMTFAAFRSGPKTSSPVGSICATPFIRLPERRQLVIHALARPALVAERPVVRQAVPRVEAQIAREGELVRIVECLPRDAQRRDRDAGRQPRRPQHRVVLDRHEERIGLHLHAHLEFDVGLDRACGPCCRADNCRPDGTAGRGSSSAPSSSARSCTASPVPAPGDRARRNNRSAPSGLVCVSFHRPCIMKSRDAARAGRRNRRRADGGGSSIAAARSPSRSGVTKVGVQTAVKSCVCFSSSHSFSPGTPMTFTLMLPKPTSLMSGSMCGPGPENRTQQR